MQKNSTKRKRCYEKKLLANKVFEEKCKSPCSCLNCGGKINTGNNIFLVKTKKGETKASFCSKNCQHHYRDKVLNGNTSF